MSERNRRRFRLRRRSKSRAPIGAPPGTLVIDPAAPAPVIRVFAYDRDECDRHDVTDLDELEQLRDSSKVVWIDVVGLGDEAMLRRVGDIFGLHRLALEDVVNTTQRPKFEPYADHLYIVFRMLTNAEDARQEQLSVFLGKGYVLTFQERTGDCFEPVRQRLRNAQGRLRNAGADYLMYALIDTVIDSYFPMIERMGDRLEQVEDEILESADEESLRRAYTTKRQLVDLRRAIWPLREAIGSLMREETGFIEKATLTYLRDCYDHTIQVIDMLETARELASAQMDLYMTQLSNRMNEIMKVLTIFAAIFIPLSFLAGLYGMNFDTDSPWNLPELGWRYGYPAALLLMALTAGGLLLFFRHRGWIGKPKRSSFDESQDKSDDENRQRG